MPRLNCAVVWKVVKTGTRMLWSTFALKSDRGKLLKQQSALKASLIAKRLPTSFLAHRTKINFTCTIRRLPKTLYRNAAKLGDVLHYIGTHHKDENDIFWSKTRAFIVHVYKDAWIACKGTLLSPPLYLREA